MARGRSKAQYARQAETGRSFAELKAAEEARLGRPLHMRGVTGRGERFRLTSAFRPTGDQPEAIRRIAEGFRQGMRAQTLLGVTGSGKTFTMANVIQELQRPALVLEPNKTLAGQVCSEFRAFFPENRVEYFVSYYDYYQPEAYIPSSDTYIEKDSAINDEIDRMRHAATASLLERRDVIIVASVSCIYGLGDPEDYRKLMLHLRPGDRRGRDELIRDLVRIQYSRNDYELKRGCFRVRGEVLDIVPSSENSHVTRVVFFDDEIEDLFEMDPLNGEIRGRLSYASIYPASHYTTTDVKMKRAIASIAAELDTRLAELRGDGRVLEAYRLEQRTRYDLEMLAETGFTKGIENYSRHLAGREPGSAPYTLLDFFPDDYLLFLDESHVSVPQVGAMFNGDHARKESLVAYGFRLPSAFDNRPLQFREFEARMGQTLFVSATPGPYEREHQEQSVEQIIRPTGLLDPEISVRPVKGEVEDLIGEIRKVRERGERALVLTLTKRMSEQLAQVLAENELKTAYLHSELENEARLRLLHDLRQGLYDVLVGINLLREGLDLPEVSLIAILDADQRGFLRSQTSLIQIIGRAARNVNGRVVMYADEVTDAMYQAIQETNRRRKIQAAYNLEHGVTPRSVQKEIRAVIQTYEDLDLLEPKSDPALGIRGAAESPAAEDNGLTSVLTHSAQEAEAIRAKLRKFPKKRLETLRRSVERDMQKAAKELAFEEAARLRDLGMEIEAILAKKASGG